MYQYPKLDPISINFLIRAEAIQKDAGMQRMNKHQASFMTATSLAVMLAACGSDNIEPEPRFEPFGIDLSKMDSSVDPGDDFFRYVGGNWYKTHQFPADSSYEGTRSDLTRLRVSRIAELIGDATANPDQSILFSNVGRFYNSYMNSAAINEIGLSALTKQLAEINTITSHEELMALFASAPWSGQPSPIKASVFYDFHHPGWLRYTLEPGGIALSRKTYLDGTEKSSETLENYRSYLIDVLELSGTPSAATSANEILNLEQQLAGVQWPRVDTRNFLKTANSLSLEELQLLTPDFDWKPYLDVAGVSGITKVLVKQPDMMQPLLTLIGNTPVEVWKKWAKVHLITQNAQYLSDEIADLKFDFFSRKLSGLTDKGQRSVSATKLTERYFGMALGQLYVERWFPERNKQMADEMFGNIKTVMRERIVNSSWMSDYTKSEAIKKIDTLNLKVGYPGSWDTVEAFDFSEDQFFENLALVRKTAWMKRAAMLHSRLPNDRWMTTPQTSGGATNPSLNEITMPAGALEPPFFDPAADPAVNYGAIGAIFGHELSHLFDQIGRQMDATGKLRDWWDKGDAAEFQVMADKIIEQYNQFDTPYGSKLNGRATANENIADISGISLAYEAWKRTASGKKNETLNGYSGDQRFFMSWAQMRTEKMREALFVRQATYGPHAPGIYRVNGVVRHHPAWYQAFGVTESNALYFPPAQRVNFWNTRGNENEEIDK